MNPGMNLKLKARCRKISLCLGTYLPSDYEQTLVILEEALQGLLVQSSFLISKNFMERMRIIGMCRLQH